MAAGDLPPTSWGARQPTCACGLVILFLQQHPFLGVALAEWLRVSCGTGGGATKA